MRNFVFILASLIASYFSQAQIKTPQPSPKSTLTQVVGLTDVTIEYSRPSVKGRAIYGDLVPLGKLWRTGANANTMVSFSEDVTIDGNTLKKGKYALYTIPKVDKWEIIFYMDYDNWGTPEKWDDTKVALKTTVPTLMLSEAIESFTIDINNLTNDSATLDIIWEKNKVSLKFLVPTQKMAMANIDKALSGPTASDYFSAAQYYYQSNADMNKALEYVNKAIAMSEPGKDVPFWQLRVKSLIQAKLNDKKGAIETAKLSLEGAKKAKNDDYIKMNSDSIKEWSKK